MKTYKAPWSTSLIVISSLATILCTGIAIGMLWKSGGLPPSIAVLPLVLIFSAALFTIRGYTVTSDAILVHRLFWATRLPIADLQSAQFEPSTMRSSIRTFGNGGVFSFTGFFRNKRLGAYRALVTDPNRTVVLHFSNRTVVVSPAAPEEFVQDISVASRQHAHTS
jgi:hypothetical protein